VKKNPFLKTELAKKMPTEREREMCLACDDQMIHAATAKVSTRTQMSLSPLLHLGLYIQLSTVTKRGDHVIQFIPR
jgi:molybdopterin-guanine dinucleotide biosynthesis protein A